MNFCDLHKENCENIVNIIEFKKGKIKELNVCLDCLINYLDINQPSEINQKQLSELKHLIANSRCSKCNLNKKDLYTNKLLCPYCYENFNITKKEDKIFLIKTKMKAAIEVEDYETASILKKELEMI